MLNRSLLFVPANKEKMLAKVEQLQADVVLLDLEDAVGEEEKQASRDLIQRYIGQWTKPVVIRVNGIESDFFADDMNLIQAISGAPALKGVMLPEAESPQAIQTLAAHLDDAERHNTKQAPLAIIPLIESALGMYHLDDIIPASSRVTRLAFGGEDFTYDIGAETTAAGNELLFARHKMVLASRVHRVGKPIDTVYTDLNNTEGFQTTCTFAKSLGFGGKLLIHPKQIEGANTAFSPSEAEITFAQNVVSQAEHHSGAFRLEGNMIDKPIIEKAKQVLDDATGTHSKEDKT